MPWPTAGSGSGWEQFAGTGEIEFALKHFYLPAIEEQKNNARVLLANLERNEKDVSGDYAYIPIMLGRNWGIGMRKNREGLPDPGYQKGARTQIQMRYAFGQIIVTLHAMAATRNTQGSYAAVLDVETQGLMEDLPKDINRQLFGDGTGRIGELTGDGVGAGPTVWTIDNANIFSPKNANELTKYFEVGQRIEIWTADGVTNKYANNPGVISAVPSASTFTTLTDADSVGADGDFVYLDGNKDQEVTGLGAMIASTGTYQGINRATAGNERWKANVNATSGDITEDLLQQSWTACEKASGMSPNIIIGTYELRDKYASILQTNRRYVNTISYKGGFSGVEFNGVGLVPDPDAPRGHVWMINMPYISLYQQAPMQFMDDDGNILSRKSGYAAYEATTYWFFEMGARRCNVHARISGVNQ